MSYRKIIVDGKQYEYSIGKTHTKIKGMEVYKNSDIGDEIESTTSYEIQGYVVSPYNVANAIKGVHKPRQVIKCEHGTQTHETTACPYSSEIDNEYVPMINCKHCVAQSAGNI